MVNCMLNSQYLNVFCQNARHQSACRQYACCQNVCCQYASHQNACYQFTCCKFKRRRIF